MLYKYHIIVKDDFTDEKLFTFPLQYNKDYLRITTENLSRPLEA